MHSFMTLCKLLLSEYGILTFNEASIYTISTRDLILIYKKSPIHG